MTRAIFLASGLQAYSCTFPFMSNSFCASPPRRSSSQNLLVSGLLPSSSLSSSPPLSERKERYFPSGLQRGDSAPSLPLVTGKWVCPSQLLIQIWETVLSLAESTVDSV